jgi:hypothetical protein
MIESEGITEREGLAGILDFGSRELDLSTPGKMALVVRRTGIWRLQP